MDASAHFKGKRITLMRIGLLGRGVQDAAYLAECGAEILVVDDALQEVIQPSVDALKGYTNIRFKFGPYDLNDFNNCDLVLKGAGAAFDSPEIAEAHKHNIPVRMSADLFAEISGVVCIGVTGTRGKSTVVHMLHHILKEAGKKVLLGGNVRGVSTLALLKETTPEHIAVLELDSWQLQGWGEVQMSPHIAVFTTLYQDHLNYYGSTSLTTSQNAMDAYLADKANIFLYQKAEDTLILGKQCAPTIIDKYGLPAQAGDKIKAKTVVVDELKLPDTWILSIPGMHNRYNAALALAAARAAGVADDISRRALESFTGVPGRLEFITEEDGIRIYNDNSSTTPEATIAALRAVGDASKQRVVLIMGGDEKNLNMTGLISEIPLWCSNVVLFKERGTKRIRDEIFALKSDELTVYEEEGFEATVSRAFSVAKSGDTILYSPAFSSFGKYFKNEYDRGDQFVALVKNHTA